MEQAIFEPLKLYKSELRDKHRRLTEEYFDSLLKSSGVNEEENAHLMSERKKALTKLNAADKLLRQHKVLRGFLIFFIVLLILAPIITDLYLVAFGYDMLLLEILLPVVEICEV